MAMTFVNDSTFPMGEFVKDNAEGLTRAMEEWEVWLSATGFVTVINLASIMGIVLFPLMKKSFYTTVMETMIGLAIGSLSGSALFHLIPQAFRLDSIEHNSNPNSYLNIALIVWIAAWAVMNVECAIKICVKMRAKANEKFHLHKASTKATVLSVESNELEKAPKDDINKSSPGTDSMDSKPEKIEMKESKMEPFPPPPSKTLGSLPIYRSTLSLRKVMTETETTTSMDTTPEDSQSSPIKSVAWIIIIGDSIHNFIDGVSIGTAFVKNFHTGAIISAAIICEEFPHELGDFAVLINSGLSVKKALLFNLLSALTCYAGMVVGILLGEISWDGYIFAFAAGIFLYVSLGDMVPELTSQVDEVSNISPINAAKVLLNYNVGILVGVSILYVLAVYQP